MEPLLETDVPSAPPDRSLLGKGIYTLSVLLIVLFAFVLRYHMAGVYLDDRGSWDESKRFRNAGNSAELMLAGMGFGEVFHPREEVVVDDNGLAILFALVWGITGVHTLACYHQSLLVIDTLILLLMICLTRKVFGRAASILCGLILAVYLPGILDAITGDVYVFAYYFTVVVAAMVIWLPRRLALQVPILILTGLVAVLGSMIRGTFLFYAFVPAIFLGLKYGKKRGLLLAGIFLIVSLGGNLIAKVGLENPTHQFWHAVYVGFGEFPNRMGMDDRDEAGFEAVYDVTKVDTKYDKPYLIVLKNLSFILIDENPWQYVQTLVWRTWRVVCAPQSWGLFEPSLSADQEAVLSWTLFVLSLIGVGLAIREKRRDSLLFILTFLYFSFTLIPILSTHGFYFLPSSIVHVVFASFALSRIRWMAAGTKPTWLSHPSQEAPWATDPYSRRFLVVSIGLGALVCLAGTGAFVVYAGRASADWKREFLAQVDAHERIQSWGRVPTEKADFTVPSEILSVGLPRTGVPYLLHIVLAVERGRIGMQVMSQEGKGLSEVVHTSAVGRSHCFLSWVADSTEEVELYAWDALPSDLDPLTKPHVFRSIKMAFDHYHVVDHAKLDWFPENRIEATSTINGLATRRIPFQLQKQVLNVFGQPYLPAWRGKVPCTVTLEMPRQPEISNLVLHQTSVPNLPFTLQAKKVGDLVPWMVEERRRQVDEKAGKVRISFDPTPVLDLVFNFQGGAGDPFLDLRDISIPDPARFEVLSAELYRAGDGPDATGFPVRLSFRAP